jgi:hypothetical protein
MVLLLVGREPVAVILVMAVMEEILRLMDLLRLVAAVVRIPAITRASTQLVEMAVLAVVVL